MNPKGPWYIVSVITILTLVAGVTTLVMPAKSVQAATINVPTDFPTVQAAVNAANPGDTVNIAAGIYTEQVIINKNLTLSGTGNPIIQAPGTISYYTFPEGDSNQWEPVIFAFGGTLAGNAISGAGQVTVNISGITVDGNSRVPSPTSRRAVGILYRNVLGGVDGCTVQNMGYSTAGINSWGIMVYGSSNVILHGNKVSGYAKGGFVIAADLVPV